LGRYQMMMTNKKADKFLDDFFAKHDNNSKFKIQNSKFQFKS